MDFRDFDVKDMMKMEEDTPREEFVNSIYLSILHDYRIADQNFSISCESIL